MHSINFIRPPEKQYSPAENVFTTIFLDVTQKCNMECANCYAPDRTVPDLDMSKVWPVLEQLPFKTEIRLYGGEPTVRKDLPEIISKIRQLGHRPQLLTNGLMLGRGSYAQELYDAGLRSVHLSLNGADDDDVYEKMDGIRCADRKIKAWENLSELKMFVQASAILQKNVNDHVPSRLKLLNPQSDCHTEFRFRNIMQSGRWAVDNSANWTHAEMIKLVCDQFNIDPEWASNWNRNNKYDEATDHIFFPLNDSARRKAPWIKITDWSTRNVADHTIGNQKRGILNANFMLESFFGYLIRTNSSH